jgi:hypothetical protein
LTCLRLNHSDTEIHIAAGIERTKRKGYGEFAMYHRLLVLRVTAVCAISLLLTNNHACGEDKEDAAQKAVEKFNAIADGEARGFDISHADDTGNSFELAKQPLLLWTNPVSGSIRGRVYLWTHEGIPVLIASVYKYDNQIQVSSEFHALARKPIVGKSSSGEAWKVDAASIEFKPVPNAGVPGTTRPVRLAQMREIARRFTASRTDPDKSNWDLRLLAQPLYRYPDATENRTDGALFAFVQGTNPDVILMIEADAANGESKWKYSLARMHRYELKVDLDGASVFQFGALTNQEILVKSKPYTVFRTQLAE